MADEGVKGRGVDVGDALSPTGCVCVYLRVCLKALFRCGRLHRGSSAEQLHFGISNLTIQRSDHFWTSHLFTILDPTALPDFLLAIVRTTYDSKKVDVYVSDFPHPRTSWPWNYRSRQIADIGFRFSCITIPGLEFQVSLSCLLNRIIVLHNSVDTVQNTSQRE